MVQQITWQMVDAAGERLGASKFNRDKWRSRGVPPSWQIKIFEDMKARGFEFPFSDFNQWEPKRAAA